MSGSMNGEQQPELMTIDGLAAYLRTTRASIHGLRRRGHLVRQGLWRVG